jgi:hypothetical protein
LFDLVWSDVDYRIDDPAGKRLFLTIGQMAAGKNER